MILKCTCQSECQDLRYDPGQRVHNKCLKDKRIKYRCTVCSDMKESGQSEQSQAIE